MKHQITTTKGVRKYLYDLIDILYEKEYFGFEEYSIEYATCLFEDIEQNLPKKIRKPAPEHFDKYGYNMYYASFKKNQQTTWYVFCQLAAHSFGASKIACKLHFSKCRLKVAY